ncbi:MAG: MFS transporter [Anaerovoracaceae bacterium]|jgi:MFS family permease
MKESELEGTGYKVYGYRWVVLLVYAVNCVLIQVMWTTFFSISTDAWKYYGFTDPVKGNSAISLLSVIFMIGMVILSVPVMWAFERWGFKKSVGFGCVLMAISAILRGVFGASYGGLIATTIGFSFAQPFILNSPGLVAGKWFPENERATANSVGLLAGYIGMCIGLLATPVLLQSMTIKGILMLYGMVSIAGALLFVIFAKEEPPTPPCEEEKSERSSFKEGIKYAWKQKNFRLCVLIFFLMLGVFNTFFTDIEALIQTLGSKAITSTQVGLIGVVILIVGTIGSLVLSMLSDKDELRRRKRYVFGANILGLAGLLLMSLFNGFGGMTFAAVIYGFFTVGSAPVLLTMAAESCYPTSEGTSEGLLLWAGNVAGVVFVGGASLLGGHYNGLYWLLVACTVVALILLAVSKEIVKGKVQE